MLQDSFEVKPAPGAASWRRPSERLFSDREETVMTRSARGYLLSLVRDGQLNRLQMELIVHYVSFFWDAPVGVRDVEILLDQVVFGQDPVDHVDPDAPESWPGQSRH